MRAAAAIVAAIISLPVAVVSTAKAEEIGEVDTAFKLLGSNHKIVVEVFDDPKIEGVSCFVSRAKKGGLRGTLGIAEDTSDASIACRQTGPIRFLDELEAGEEVFRRRTSIIFKTMQVVRFWDPERNTLIYLTYSDKVIDGSPKNAISAVVVEPWEQAEVGRPDYDD